ncbi:MAG: FAD-dependent oxidoreductase, partial [Ktedonobacterales bacterium]
AAVLAKRLVAEGVTLLTRTEVRSVSIRDGLKVVEAATPEGTRQIGAEEILVAVGRSPTVDDLGLDAAHVTCDRRKGIATDAYLRTSNSRIFAAGDVRGGYLFTHAAALQARTAVRNMLLPAIARSKLDERVMPWATFTEPEIAHVGLTEAEARKEYGGDVRSYTQPLAGVDRAVTEGEAAGFIKLVCMAKGKLLGATIAGPSAGEYINELALALSQELSLAQIAGVTHAYPTVALGIQQAAGRYTLEATSKSGVVRFLRRLAG